MGFLTIDFDKQFLAKLSEQTFGKNFGKNRLTARTQEGINKENNIHS